MIKDCKHVRQPSTETQPACKEAIGVRFPGAQSVKAGLRVLYNNRCIAQGACEGTQVTS